MTAVPATMHNEATELGAALTQGRRRVGEFLFRMALRACLFIAFAFLRAAITGHPWLSEVAPITGPMYQLFIFFMITDPKTTVRPFWGQCLVAFLVAAVECLFRLLQWVHAPYYALFVVGPTANLIDIAALKLRTKN